MTRYTIQSPKSNRLDSTVSSARHLIRSTDQMEIMGLLTSALRHIAASSYYSQDGEDFFRVFAGYIG